MVDPRQNTYSQTQSDTIDQGLREYMLKVYNYMTSGLAISGLVAWSASQSPALMNLVFGSALKWVVMLAPLGFIFFLGARMQKMSNSAAQMTFWAFAAVMGLSMSYIFILYTGASITRVFFITCSVFAAMSIYGYTTKRDLTKFGSFLMMGLLGIIIASVVNIFMAKNVKFCSTNDLLGFCGRDGTFDVLYLYTLYRCKYYKSVFYHL